MKVKELKLAVKKMLRIDKDIKKGKIKVYSLKEAISKYPEFKELE